MANTHEHRYSVSITWSGNLGSGTSGYRDYSRNYEIGADGKPVIPGSADPAFRGDRARWNPEELLVASLSACHKLWYLHLAGEAGVRAGDRREGHGGDQFAVLAACATQTSRILLGTSITSVFVRTAPTIAMAAATLDELTGGRFILGVGSSHKVQVEAEHGIAYGKPLTPPCCMDQPRGRHESRQSQIGAFPTDAISQPRPDQRLAVARRRFDQQVRA
jgi:organic hydroperoxide reductase OsmC/OhrA